MSITMPVCKLDSHRYISCQIFFGALKLNRLFSCAKASASANLATGQLTFRVPKGRFDPAVLTAVGHRYAEVDPADARFGGEGLWVAISRDPKTGVLRAASHNRNNSAAVAR